MVKHIATEGIVQETVVSNFRKTLTQILYNCVYLKPIIGNDVRNEYKRK